MTGVQNTTGAATASAAAAAQDDATAFLLTTLATQTDSIAAHRWYGRRVWIKKAGPRNPRWRYAVLGFLARRLRLAALTPVPNLGGPEAIAQEARRLRELGALGLRVPAVLAESPAGLMISDLGPADGAPVDSMLGAVSQAAARGPEALLAQWQRGLDAIARVHARGGYLSQAFARNLVDCADGVVGYIDFEDDPGASLPLAECQVRDWLSYLHSTALYLVDGEALQPALARWRSLRDAQPAAVREGLARAVDGMRWLRRLPAGARWGRDVQRVRSAAQFLVLAEAENLRG